MRIGCLTSPGSIRSVLTGCGYFAASALAVALTRFGGGAAFIWVANAVLLASLGTCRPAQWPGLILLCWSAGVVAAGMWGLGWTASPFIAAANVLEPVIAAGLIGRWRIHRTGLDSPRNLSGFLLAAGLIAPSTTGVLGAVIIDQTSGTGVGTNYFHWLVGHALGAVTFTPIFEQIASGEVQRWWGKTQWRNLVEAILLLIFVAITAISVFAQTSLPLLFLPALPLMLITFRVGKIGASMAIVVMTAIGVILTLHGVGPVNMIHSGLGERLQFLQLYLAVTVLTVLPVAADLTRRKKLFDQLRDSEARFRLITENSTDIVLSLDVDGVIRYASPSIRLLVGHDPDKLIGKQSSALVCEPDRDEVRAVHIKALRSPDQTFTVEFRGVVPGGDVRWFETHTRAVTDERGAVQGAVSAVRETSRRRQHEAELTEAALTDPLTGVCNRRAFDRALSELSVSPESESTGCIAIFDLDHFKRVNDMFGHAIGDEVLRAFARTARLQIRDGDLLARIGGEEFGIVFRQVPPDRVYLVCERIRQAVAADVVRAGDWPVHVTVSIGIATLDVGDDPFDVLKRADRALYKSKEEGRNRSSLAG